MVEVEGKGNKEVLCTEQSSRTRNSRLRHSGFKMTATNLFRVLAV